MQRSNKEYGVNIRSIITAYYSSVSSKKTIDIVMLKLIRLKITIKFRDDISSMLHFANDIVLIAESKGSIQHIINEL